MHRSCKYGLLHSAFIPNCSLFYKAKYMKVFGEVKTVSSKFFAPRILDINIDCAQIDSPEVCKRELGAMCLSGDI